MSGSKNVCLTCGAPVERRDDPRSLTNESWVCQNGHSNPLPKSVHDMNEGGNGHSLKSSSSKALREKNQPVGWFGKLRGTAMTVPFSVFIYLLLANLISGGLMVGVIAIYILLLPAVYRLGSGGQVLWIHEQAIVGRIKGRNGCLSQILTVGFLLVLIIAILEISYRY